MYSPNIIAKRIAKAETTFGIKLVKHPVGRVLEIVAHLEKIPLNKNGQPARDLTKAEKVFIRNERLMCRYNFLYWAERYCTIALDGGGIGYLKTWESQNIVLRIIARLEEELVRAVAAKEPIDGVLLVLHKARQLGATMLGRALTMHRLITSPDIRAVAASVDEDKVQELYDRDKTIYDNLPWWMRPRLTYDEKRQHLYFEGINTRILYQQGSQKSGVGQGRQFDLSHLTECGSWPYPATIEHDFFPTIPQSVNTLSILEATAQGRGNWWHDFVERVRAGYSRRWKFVFIPWYAEPKKYRAKPPVDWKPAEVSMMHAMKVHQTSPEFVGHAVMLPPENLYWWETTHEEYARAGKTNLFLTNFCATPEESFQHTTQSAFSADVLERLRLATSNGSPYEIRTTAAS